MIKADPKTGMFQGIGYQTGKSLTLVRNPNWNPKTRLSRPAYLNQINFNIGGDATVIGQQVLKGSDAVQLDTPAQSIVKLAYEQYPSQITFTPGSGDHYVALDNAARPVQERQPAPGGVGHLDRAAIVKAARRLARRLSRRRTSSTRASTASSRPAGPPARRCRGTRTSTATSHGRREVHEGRRLSESASTPAATVQIVGANNGNDPAIIQIVEHRPDAARLPDARQPGRPVGHVREVLRRAQAGDRRLPDRSAGSVTSPTR